MNLEGVLPSYMLGITGPLSSEQEADIQRYYDYVRRLQMTIKTGMRVRITQLTPAYEANPLLLRVRVGDVGLVTIDPNDIGLALVKFPQGECFWLQSLLEESKE